MLFTQRNLFFEALNFVESTGIGPGDPILCPIPLYHSYGLCLGMLDAVFFPNAYRQAKEIIASSKPFLVTGTMEMDVSKGEPLLRAERAVGLE